MSLLNLLRAPLSALKLAAPLVAAVVIAAAMPQASRATRLITPMRAPLQPVAKSPSRISRL